MMKMKIYCKCDIGGDVMMFFMITYVDCHHHQLEVKGNHVVSWGGLGGEDRDVKVWNTPCANVFFSYLSKIRQVYVTGN